MAAEVSACTYLGLCGTGQGLGWETEGIHLFSCPGSCKYQGIPAQLPGSGEMNFVCMYMCV